MKNPTGNKLEKLIFGMFDQMVEGADKYVTKQESTWLIFTEDKRWVIEFTRDKTLWFNYNIFQSELELIGKDCTEERDLIKRWFESRFLNKPKVKEAHHVDVMKFFDKKMENTIENGVKNTLGKNYDPTRGVEDIIQNGVKRTEVDEHKIISDIKDVIQNGVKETKRNYDGSRKQRTKYVIENGVKEATPSGYLGSIEMKGKIVHQIESPKQNNEVEDTIQNGVKETKENRLIRTISVISTINNGVKETKESMLESLEQIDHQVTNCEITESINDVIENGVKEIKEISNISLTSEIFKVKAKQAISDGVKEIQPLPAQDGNRDWGLYYQRQGNLTKPHTEYVKEIIEDSYNHMGRVEGVIRNTDKDGI